MEGRRGEEWTIYKRIFSNFVYAARSDLILRNLVMKYVLITWSSDHLPRGVIK